MLPRAVDHDNDDDVEDESDDDGPVATAAPPKSGLEAALTMVAPYLPEMLESWRGKPAAANVDQRAVVNPMAHLARIQAQLTSTERQFLDALLLDDDAEAITRDLAARSVVDAVATLRRGAAGTRTQDVSPSPQAAPRIDAATMQKLTAIATLLEPEKRARLMKLGPKLMSSPDAIELVNTLARQVPEAAAKWIRANLDELEARFAS